MHQSLQMVTRVHFTLSTATHNNNRGGSPSRLPPLNWRHCTSKTVWEVYYEHTTGIRGFKPDFNKLRDSFTTRCCIQRVLKALGFPNKNYRWHLTAWRSNIGPLPLFLCLCYLPLWIQIHQTAGLRLLLPNVQSLPALCELLSPRFVSPPLSTQTCPFIIPLANTCLSHGSISARYTADAHFPIY